MNEIEPDIILKECRVLHANGRKLCEGELIAQSGVKKEDIPLDKNGMPMFQTR